jgi:hypothetical protein
LRSQCLQKIGHERPQIGQSVAPRSQDDDCNRSPRQIPLKREIAVGRDEDIERRRGKRKQFAVFDGRPTHLDHDCPIARIPGFMLKSPPS